MSEDRKYEMLESLEGERSLRSLSLNEVSELNKEIREYLIENVSRTGGHLASNLGAVELSVALHRVFDTPYDHIVWDVGHQAYVHKMLTGRLSKMNTLRQAGGISGFPKRSESEHDCFGAGHSSTSLSAALGFAEADKLSGSDAYTVAVVGDGAFTGGMIHEALNNCSRDLKLIIIINENEMSISKNIGRFAQNMSRIRVKKGYFKFKRRVARVVNGIPFVGKKLFRFIKARKKSLKNALYGSNIFEDLGLYYLGPVNGNDYNTVEELLREAKGLGESVVIHIKTKKGKGYKPAEENPSFYHGMPPAGKKQEGKTYSEVFGETAVSLAESDPKVCTITAAMCEGTGLSEFRKRFPERFFDVGIAEEHAVTFAAGLSANGYTPIFAVYSTFLQRGYDQLIHDAALQSLPVVFGIDRAGLNACDGATHNGVFDVAFMSEIPGLYIYTPATLEGLRLSLTEAVNKRQLAAVRYPSGREEGIIKERFYGDTMPDSIAIRTTLPKDRREEFQVLIVTHGRIAKEALEAEDKLKVKGITACTVLCEFIKPYDKLADLVEKYLPSSPCAVVFVEEEIRSGGFGMMLSYELRERKRFRNKHFDIVALNSGFEIRGTGKTMYESARVSADFIVDSALKIRKKYMD